MAVRWLHAAEALAAHVTGANYSDAGRILADRITWFMQRVGVPNGLQAVGYSHGVPVLSRMMPATTRAIPLIRSAEALSPSSQTLKPNAVTASSPSTNAYK